MTGEENTSAREPIMWLRIKDKWGGIHVINVGYVCGIRITQWGIWYCISGNWGTIEFGCDDEGVQARSDAVEAIAGALELDVNSLKR